jgi:ribosomal protein L4
MINNTRTLIIKENGNKNVDMNTVPMTRSAVTILKNWHLDAEQRRILLGCETVKEQTKLESSSEDYKLSFDQINRLALILDIDHSIRQMFNNSDNINGFMTMVNHNRPFNGKRPVDLALANINDFISVKDAISGQVHS